MCKMSASAIAQPSVAQLSQEFNVDVQPITQPSVAQLTNSNFSLPITHVSWSNNLVLMQKVKDIKARYWYMIQCISANWTRDYLKEAIELDYYKQHGALANNFQLTLPKPEAEEVRNSLKDPFCLIWLLSLTNTMNVMWNLD